MRRTHGNTQLLRQPCDWLWLGAETQPQTSSIVLMGYNEFDGKTAHLVSVGLLVLQAEKFIPNLKKKYV